MFSFPETCHYVKGTQLSTVADEFAFAVQAAQNTDLFPSALIVQKRSDSLNFEKLLFLITAINQHLSWMEKHTVENFKICCFHLPSKEKPVAGQIVCFLSVQTHWVIVHFTSESHNVSDYLTFSLEHQDSCAFDLLMLQTNSLISEKFNTRYSCQVYNLHLWHTGNFFILIRIKQGV